MEDDESGVPVVVIPGGLTPGQIGVIQKGLWHALLQDPVLKGERFHEMSEGQLFELTAHLVEVVREHVNMAPHLRPFASALRAHDRNLKAEARRSHTNIR